MSVVIKVEDVSKQYRLGVVGRHTITHDFNRWWHKVRGKEDPYLKIGQENNRAVAGTSDYVWSLKDINFQVNQGEVLGIIGRNGAGKSTLLKLLSKVTAPTTGQIKIRGRIASLLEVGTGFHPDLSGRNNVFLNGAILGMTKREISKKFDEIIDFAGIERYIDTPVKRYSSGMYVRLAFAVAAHLEPEVLIIDEVLAVGDAEFQKKCLGKMKDVSTNEGRTILFVSHDMASISTLTSRAICLYNGTMAIDGETKDVIRQYLHLSRAEAGVYENKINTSKPNITRAEVITSETQGIHKQGETLRVMVDVNMPYFIESMAISVQICNDKETSIIYTYAFDSVSPILRKVGINTLELVLPNCKLYQGTYYLLINLAESKGKAHFEIVDKVCRFEVQMLEKMIEWGWRKDVCIYTEDFKWNAC